MTAHVDPQALAQTYRAHIAWLTDAYARVLREAGYDGVVVHGGTAARKSIFDDQYWPLVVVPHFRHWLPLEAADSALLIAPGQQPRLFHLDDGSYWESPTAPETDHFWASFDKVDVKTSAQIGDALRGRGKLAFLGENRAQAAAWGFADADTAPPELMAKLDALRTRKTAYERLCLREANRRACVGHAAVLDAFRQGDASELELHLLYLRATQQDDPETPYKNIVALGEHAATLHHVGYGRRQQGALSLLLDAGARYQGYDSDITRTAVKGTTAGASLFGGLVAEVEKLQRALCDRVQVGMPYEQLHNESHELLATALRTIGIGKASDDELVASGVTRKFLPHGLGHSIGIQTHDVGCAVIRPEPRNPHLRNTSTVVDGQVFTIEPGCYFIDGILGALRDGPQAGLVDWKVVDALAPFGGVRIEDDLFVGSDVEGSGGTAPVENFTRSYLP